MADSANVVLVNSLIRDSGKRNAHGLRIPIKSSWNFVSLEKMLKNYQDKEIIDYLKYGWPIGHDGSATDTRIPKNQEGALKNQEALNSYVQKEKAYHAVAGGYKQPPFAHSKISPLDTRKKRDSNELRVILNLSHPYTGGSVNQGISKTQYLGKQIELHYPSVDTLVQMIINKKKDLKLQGKNKKVLLFKKDLKRAYRWINVDFGDVHLLGYKIGEEFYFDLVLPNGLRSAAYIMQRVSSALRFIFQQEGYDLANFLDDLGSCEIESEAWQAYDTLGEIITRVGLKESLEKACPPSEEMVFLGTGLNTISMTLFITPDRVEEILNILLDWKNRTHATLREVQSLLGKLNFVTNCVNSSRIYISRILNFLREMRPGKKYQVPQTVKEDVEWWQEFIPIYNYRSSMITNEWEEPDRTIMCDATPQRTARWSEGEFFSRNFPAELLNDKKTNINELECITATACVKIWASKCVGKKLKVFCDNKATVIAINTGRSKNKRMQACLRELHHTCGLVSCELRMQYIRTSENRIPDALSRLHLGPKYKEEFETLTKNVKKTELTVADSNFLFAYTKNSI